MKKVLQVVGSMNVGGTETMLMNLYKNIDRKKINFDFLYYIEEECFYDSEIIKLGAKIIRIASPSNLGVIKSVIVIKDLIKKENYDIVHAHTLFNCGIVMVAAKLAGVKIRISHAHTSEEIDYRFIRKLYYKVMKIMINKFSTNFLAASEIAGKFLFGKKIVKSKKYEFLANFINYEEIINSNKKNLKIELGIKNNEYVIGTVGRFIAIKNQNLLIDLAKNIKEEKKIKFKVILVGDGDNRKRLEEKIKELNVEEEVILTGYRKDVVDLINIMDVFILPSKFEGFGMVAVEAQVAGVPVIISDTVPKETDLKLGLVQRLSINDNISLWRKKVELVLDKKISDKKLIENALENCKFTKKHILDTIYEIYKVN